MADSLLQVSDQSLETNCGDPRNGIGRRGCLAGCFASPHVFERPSFFQWGSWKDSIFLATLTVLGMAVIMWNRFQPVQSAGVVILVAIAASGVA